MKLHPDHITKVFLSTKIGWGKHKGKQVYDIIYDDVEYANWLLNDCLKDKEKNFKVERMLKLYLEKREGSKGVIKSK